MTAGSPILVHQVVHGYAEGHREIAGSIRLKSRDSRTVSVLSDVSSAGFRLPERGYLTGYPLSESSAYVLARTWPAAEISRPGAVWTHSLILEFGDLPAIADARNLLGLFRRPTPSISGWESIYRSALALNTPGLIWSEVNPPTEGEVEFREEMEEWAASLLVALYEMPNAMVAAPIAPLRLPLAEDVVLALWSQQWPRLRRSFRFCTQALSDRRVDGAAFDLQVLPDTGKTPRSALSTFVNAASVIRAVRPAWLRTALLDLHCPGPLRSFLLAVGSVSEGGRASYAPLVTLYGLLAKDELTAEDADQALDLAQSALSISSPFLEGALVRSFLPVADRLSATALGYVLGRINSVARSDLNARGIEQIGLAAWRLSKARFVEMLGNDGALGIAARGALVGIPSEDILAVLAEESSLTAALLKHRANLLLNPSLWAMGDATVRIAVALLEHADVDRRQVVGAIAASGSLRALELTTRTLGPEAVWPLVIDLGNSAEQGSDEVFSAWVQALVPFANATASALASGSIGRRCMLHAIAIRVNPDTVPNEFGHDPWLLAAQGAHGEMDMAASVHLASFLFARALGPASRSCAELVEISFDAVYTATASESIPRSAWELMLPRLPQPGPWSSWDRCKQLRYAVAKLYVERGLSARSFSTLGNDHLFQLLLRAADKQWHGKSFLRAVKHELEHGPHGARSRVELVDKQLDSWL